MIHKIIEAIHVVVWLHGGLGWFERVVWLGGSLVWFALVIWPPGTKPFVVRLGSTTANIAWCALVLGLLNRHGGTTSFEQAFAYSITFAFFWAVPCFVFFLVVVMAASLSKRWRSLERA